MAFYEEEYKKRKIVVTRNRHSVAIDPKVEVILVGDRVDLIEFHYAGKKHEHRSILLPTSETTLGELLYLLGEVSIRLPRWKRENTPGFSVTLEGLEGR